MGSSETPPWLPNLQNLPAKVRGILLKSNSCSAYLLGAGGGDLGASESSPPALALLRPLLAGHAGGAEAKGCIVREPQLPGWRLGGLNSFTALGWLAEWSSPLPGGGPE